MSLTDLRKFSTTVIKDKSASDQAQIPATVDIDVYLRGATVSSSAIVIAAGGSATVSVYDIGRISANCTIQVGTVSTTNLTVTTVTSATSIVVRNDGGSDVALAQYSRLVVTSTRPTLYRDTTGTAVLLPDGASGHTTTDARGYVEFYTTESRFDYIATSGASLVLFSDQESGPTVLNYSYNVMEFPGTAPAGTVQVDVAAALAAIPAGAELKFPPGIYMPPTAAGWTLSKGVTIRGESAPDPSGATGTTFRPFNDDKDSTVFTIVKDDISIKDVFISCTAQPSATGTGDGIRIGSASWTPNGTCLDHVYVKFMGRHGLNVAADGNFNAAPPETTSYTHFGSDKMVITNCHFWDNRGSGIRLYAATSTSIRSTWALNNRLEGFRFRTAQTTSLISCAAQNNGVDLTNNVFLGQVVFSLSHQGVVTGLNVEDFDNFTNKNGLCNENSLAMFVGACTFGNPSAVAGSVAIQISAQARGCTITGWSVENVAKAILIEVNNKNSGNFITAPFVLAADATCPATMDIPDEATGAATSGGNLWFPPVSDYTGAHLQNQFAGIRMPRVSGTASISASLLKDGLLIYDTTAAVQSRLKYFDGAVWKVVTAV